MLRERNENYNGAIKFVDISADEYDAEDNNGIDFETVIWRTMLRIFKSPIRVITMLQIYIFSLQCF